MTQIRPLATLLAALLLSFGLFIPGAAFAQTADAEQVETPSTFQSGEIVLSDEEAFGTYSYNETMQPLFDSEEEFNAFVAETDAFSSSLTPLGGQVELASAGVVLDIGDAHYFLRGPDAQRLLEEQWGNMEDTTIIGMIFERNTDFQFHDWAVAVTFDDVGYVSDKDAADIDYVELANILAEGTRLQSEARVDAGLSSIDWKGWATPPSYDGETHRMYWAKLLKFGGTDSNTLNYNMRFLGRRGVLEFNFIATEESLDAIEASRPALAEMVSFKPGAAYADYDPSTDKVAAYGLAGLVAGGAIAKKAGALAALLLFLKKGWIFILLGAGALWRGVKSILKRHDEPAPVIARPDADGV